MIPQAIRSPGDCAGHGTRPAHNLPRIVSFCKAQQRSEFEVRAKLRQQGIEEGEAEQGDTEDTVCGEEGSVESLQSVSDKEEMLV
jgi:hypothetical protein